LQFKLCRLKLNKQCSARPRDRLATPFHCHLPTPAGLDSQLLRKQPTRIHPSISASLAQTIAHPCDNLKRETNPQSNQIGITCQKRQFLGNAVALSVHPQLLGVQQTINATCRHQCHQWGRCIRCHRFHQGPQQCH